MSRPSLLLPVRFRPATQALARGPWCWRAIDRQTGQRPPRLRPGQVLLVSVSEGQGAALWSFPTEETGPHVLGFKDGDAAVQAWASAPAAVTRSLPLLWGSVQMAARQPLRAARLALIGRDATGWQSVEDATLDGPSYGLAFALSVASMALGRPLKPEIAASAAIDATGAVHPVGDIEEKVAALALLAPGVTVFLVAPEDADTARAAAAGHGGRIKVKPVANVCEAVSEALPKLDQALAEAGTDSALRAELTRAFFNLAHRERSQALNWTPVRRAAELALERWPGLTADERNALRFAAAVAARHEGNEGQLSSPDPAWLTRLPRPVRMAVVAHYVQQAADTGSPPPAAMERIARKYVPPREELDDHNLRVQGALANLMAMRGRFAEALRLDLETARAWKELAQAEAAAWRELSYPLSRAYRLAGALGDPPAFDEAEDLRAPFEQRAAAADGLAYVALARSRAEVLLRPGDRQTRERLAYLANGRSVPDHISSSAARWYVRWLDAAGEVSTAEQVLATLEETASGRDGSAQDAARTATLFRQLVELDRALRGDDVERAAACVAALRKIQPGLVAQILRTVPARRQASHLARFFPY